MARTLLENVNGEYYRNQSILTGKPNRVKVIVEDEADVPFWLDILAYLKPDKEFSITPYSYVNVENDSLTKLSKGKAHILSKARANELNAYYIGCVDSDYDYLLQSYRETGKLMQENPYLLQTYAYSIENLLCYAETLALLCSKSVKEVPDFNFIAYLQETSRIIRPLWIRALYLETKGYNDFTATDWGNIFPCNKPVSNDTSQEKILARLQNNVDRRIQEIETKHTDIAEEIATFETGTFHEDESPSAYISKSCYLGVRGHDIYRFVLNTVLKGITQQLKSDHLNRIKYAETSEEDKNNRRKHYLNEVVDIETLLKTNYEYKHHCPIFKMIANDINHIWSNFNTDR